MSVLSGDAGPERGPGPPPVPSAPLVDHLRAVGIVAATTALALAVRTLYPVPDIEMLFLLGVMIAAITCGRGASILASLVAVIAYDFFFVPPAYTLAVADARYVLTFGMMFGVSVVMGTLARRLRDQQQAAVGRERTTSALYALSRELGAALDAPGVAAVCVRAAAEAFDAEVVLLGRRERDDLFPLATSPREAALGQAEQAVARWVLEHGAPAGAGTESLPGEHVLCLPLRTFGEVLAVITLRPSRQRGLTPSQRSFLEALVRQAALALDRVELADEARRAALRAKTEELRSGLLSAVSHDLRTPLAAITGAGTMLRDQAALDPALHRELVETVCDEAERLERLVSNLLDMTRLDSGAVEPKREWVPLVEVIGSALTRLERRLAVRPVQTGIAEDVPLLRIDPVLVEQLFVNLLENAAKYTPPGSPIEIRATREGETLVVEVADRGPGLPAGAEERVFERFFRGPHATVRGVGLGLPISRAIAQAHGGRLAAANRPGGGAVFRLTLPLPDEAPPAAGEAGDPAGGATA